MADLENIRTALIITLSIVLVVVLYRRFKQYVRARDLPQVLLAELLNVQVAYHPARLLVEIRAPEAVDLQFAVLSASHIQVHAWHTIRAQAGVATLELALPTLEDGAFFVEMRTHTQRTVRQFRLLQR